MRLTLRTLLAYLDDMLEPAEAREIGEKISESKDAAALVLRIREVIRRRRIAAPELAGPGSGPDPNLVSDYLENALPAGQVVEIERLCQASDVHLAEVAACHKILTLVLGQSLDVPDEMRERMYALGATKAAEEQRLAAGGMPPMTEGMGTAHAGSLEAGLPEYLTRRSFSHRYGAIAAVVLTAVVWMVLVLTDHSLWTSPQSAQKIAALQEPAQLLVPAPGEAVAAAREPEPAPAVAENPPPGPPEMPSQAPPAAVAATPASPAQAGSAPLPVAPPGAQPAAPAAVAPAAMPAPAADVVAPVLPLAQPELPFAYQSGDELVIRKFAMNPDWRLAQAQVPVEIEDEIASPVPFRNTYSIANVVDVTMEPGTRIRRLPRQESTALGLFLDRGQLTLFRPFATEKPSGVNLRVQNREWTLTLLEPGTRCGVEFTPPVPNGPPEKMNLSPIEGGIVVSAGRVRVETPGAAAIEIAAKDGYARWPAEAGQLVTQADLTIPSWALAEGVFVTPAAKQLARNYQKEFLPDRTVAQSIGPVTKDRRAAISDLAVKTLALIDQYQYLIPALAADHQETRLSAIQGVRQWLVRDPNNADLLREELSRAFRMEYVDTLARLIWGFDIEDARDPDNSRKLIDWMKDDQIAIRELAFYHVSRLTGRTYDYLPMAPAPERKAAVQRWEDYLKRNGGTLLPL